MNETKHCRGCKQDLELTQFYPNAHRKDGYYAKCKECIKAKRRRYYSKRKIEPPDNPNKTCNCCKRKLDRGFFYKNANRFDGLYPDCKDCCREQRAEQYQRDRQSVLDSYRRYRLKVRKRVLDHYGHKCACCGEETYEFLAIDHINNDGNVHRKAVLGKNSGSSSHSMVVWIIKNNFPPGFQILCHNCNNAKGFYGACPHQKSSHSSS